MTVQAVAACPSGQWCTESPPAASAGVLLRTVWAASADDVFAVGDGGTILRRNNDTWTAMTSGTTYKLRGVWGTSSSDVWATGLSGTILHFDGTSWSPVSATSAEIDVVWGTSSTDVWFAGQGTVLHWNGASFATYNLSGSLVALSGTSPQDAWVTGENASLRRWNGTSWSSPISTGAGSSYFAVLAIAPNDAWLADFTTQKETMHWNGVKWAPLRTGIPIATTFQSLSALSSTDIWAAGGARVGHWNGTAWTVDSPLGSSGIQLFSVTTVPGHAWIVGDGGVIAHRSL